MHRTLQRFAFAAALGLAALGSNASARAGDCRKAAIASLRSLSPDGAGVYDRVGDKSFFLEWITCDDVQLGLATAVHESVHYVTAHTDAYPLIDGGEVKRPRNVASLFAPSRMAGNFGKSDFVSTYLRPGQASSSSDFFYLLDELNAYSHDLNAAIDLQSLKPAGEQVGHRDGLAATMAFVARYVETAQEKEPGSWDVLRHPEVAEAVSRIWNQAERVMAASCGIPDFGIEDKGFIRRICEPAARSAMRGILGRPSACPSRCLAETVSLDDASE